jgi:Ca2+-binding EF-hand superfamily protein
MKIPEILNTIELSEEQIKALDKFFESWTRDMTKGLISEGDAEKAFNKFASDAEKAFKLFEKDIVLAIKKKITGSINYLL